MLGSGQDLGCLCLDERLLLALHSCYNSLARKSPLYEVDNTVETADRDSFEADGVDIEFNMNDGLWFSLACHWYTFVRKGTRAHQHDYHILA